MHIYLLKLISTIHKFASFIMPLSSKYAKVQINGIIREKGI